MIFGMNIQQVSVDQKLPVGGYTDGSGTPSTLLEGGAILDDPDRARPKPVACVPCAATA